MYAIPTFSHSPPWFPFAGAFTVFAFTAAISHYVAALLREQFDEAHGRALRAESLAAVGSLVTGAAHELRNPLGSSGAILQSLREELTESPEMPAPLRADALESIEMALQGQRRAAAIVERLYGLTDTLADVGTDIEVGALLELLREKYPTIVVAGDGAHPDVGATHASPLQVNRRAMETVLCNLLDNALAADGEEPPQLEVRLLSSPRSGPPSSGERRHSPRIGGTGGRKTIEFVVTNSGRGIPETMRSEVFQPFFTTEKAGAGRRAGLGLYVVHELVTRLGGTVALESGEGAGTRVTVRVPVP